MADEHLSVEWLDGRREPRNPPDPRYPEGIDLNYSIANWPSCRTDLPYPAKRIGDYVITCSRCGLRAVVTTAGRADDPRSVRLKCKGS